MRLPTLGIRNRMLLLGVLPTAIIFLAVVLLNFQRMQSLLLDLAEEILSERTQVIATEIDRGTLEAVTAARTMATAAEHGLFGRRQESLDLARSVLEGNPQFTAAYFGYEPNVDGQDAEAERVHRHFYVIKFYA